MRRVDIRFADVDLEKAFAASLDSQLGHSAAVAGISISAILAGRLVSVMIVDIEVVCGESCNWLAIHPRTQYLFVQLWNIFLSLVILLLAAAWRYLGGGWVRVNWELVLMFYFVSLVSSFPFVSMWHVAASWGLQPGEAWNGHDASYSEFLTLLGMHAVNTLVCLFVPMRSCLLWTVPVVGLTSFLSMIYFWGSPFPDSIAETVLGATFVTFASLAGAWRNECFARERWMALRDVVESKKMVVEQSVEIVSTLALANGMEAVVNSFCDMVVKIDNDFCMWRPVEAIDAFFGQPMHGKSLEDAVTREDRQRLRAMFDRASASSLPQCMHLTLETPGKSLEAELLLMWTDTAVPRYLAGLQVSWPES